MLELTDLHVRYGNIRALQGVSLTVATGELVALIGSNGAGKSTVLRTISGLLRPSDGTISFEGADITHAATDRIVALGISHCPEGRRIFGRLSVSDNLRLGAVAQRDSKAIAADLEMVFTLFPLLKERLQQAGGTLSGGEQQMLAIGRALMSRPRLLLLDEPSLGLAPLMVERIFETIAELKRQGRTILLVEQNVHHALDVADRAYVLETGRITLDGPAELLRKDPKVEQSYLGVGGVTDMTDYVIQQIVNALSAGSLYALMAVGLAMVFGILRLINFAHGDVMMIAAYIAVFCIGAGLPLETALVIMVVGTVIVGLLMERIAYRPLRGGPEVAMLLSSFAVGQILQNGTLLTTRLAGKPTLIAFPSPEQLSGVIMLGSITVPKVNVVSFVAGVVLLGLLTPVRDEDDTRAFDAGRCRGPRRRAADGDQGQPGRRDRVRDQRGPGRGRRFPVRGAGRPDQPVHGLHACPQGVHRRRHRRVREHRRRGPGRLRARVPRGPRHCPRRDRRPAPGRLRATRGARLPPAVAAELAGELSRRGRVHRPDPRPPRPAAGHPRPA